MQVSGARLAKHYGEWLAVQPTTWAPGWTWGIPACTIAWPGPGGAELGVLQVITPSRSPGAELVCVEIEADTPPDHEQAITAMMAKVSGAIEEQIRRRPDQWLWFPGRWKGSRRIIRRGVAAGTLPICAPDDGGRDRRVTGARA